MHLLVEVRVSAFTIILDAKWLDLALVQNSIYTGFCDGREPFKACIYSCLINVLCKSFCGPGLRCITIILRLCTSYTDQPGFRVTGDFLFTATTLIYIEKILNRIVF